MDRILSDTDLKMMGMIAKNLNMPHKDTVLFSNAYDLSTIFDLLKESENEDSVTLTEAQFKALDEISAMRVEELSKNIETANENADYTDILEHQALIRFRSTLCKCALNDFSLSASILKTACGMITNIYIGALVDTLDELGEE